MVGLSEMMDEATDAARLRQLIRVLFVNVFVICLCICYLFMYLLFVYVFVIC